jgi:circadian clock protein KaiB
MAPRTVLKLYVVGGTPASERALRGIETLRDEVDVEVVDLRERPDLAEQERIVATPLLMRVSPEPVRRLLGDLSDIERVRWTLGLPAEGA